MIKYVDFDGVMFDTTSLLFDKKYFESLKNPCFDTDKYVQNVDWMELILKSKEINEAVKILKEIKDAVILTKINSLYNEANAKIIILRELGLKNNIILVPYNLKKTDVVEAEGNILIDDTIRNLDDWKKAKGIPLFFSPEDKDMDYWGNLNTKYTKIKSLEYLKRF